MTPHPRWRPLLCWLVCASLASACGGGATARPVAARPSSSEAARRVHEQPAFELREEEVAFDAAGRAVHGTLAVPVAPGRHPALLLIAGSGPTDRDWNNPAMPGTNGSARLLAHELARRGVVVLRYDKLATGRTGAPATVAWSDYVAEQRAAHATLLAHAAVDAEHVYLAGHSEGALHALHLLEQPGERFAGLVLLAGPGRTMSDVMLGQLEGNFRHVGLSGPMLEAQMGPLRSAMQRFLGGEPVDPRTVSEIPQVQQLFASIFAPAGATFAREIFAFDPAAAVARIRIPVLVLNGGRDVQVSPDLDARPLADAARRGGNPDVTAHIAPEADHVLKHQPTPIAQLDPVSIQNGYNADGRVIDPDVLRHLVAWLADHAR